MVAMACTAEDGRMADTASIGTPMAIITIHSTTDDLPECTTHSTLQGEATSIEEDMVTITAVTTFSRKRPNGSLLL